MSEMNEEELTKEELMEEIMRMLHEIEDVNVLKDIYEETCKVLKEFVSEIEDVDMAKEIYEEFREILEEAEESEEDNVTGRMES